MRLKNLAMLAVSMARRGDAAEGYTSLLEGLGRVLPFEDAGEPWGEALVLQYRRTLDEYAHRYGVARE